MKLSTRKEAKEYIKLFKEQLSERGLLEDVDTLALNLIEVTYNNWLNATEFLLTNGTTFEAISREGSLVYRPYPEVKIQLDAHNALTKLLKEFGGTTSSRKYVKSNIVEEEEDDAIANFMKGKVEKH